MGKEEENEAKNFFNHFGLGVDKSEKIRDFRRTIPPRPPGKTKAQRDAEKKKKIQQQKITGENVDDVKSGNGDKSTDDTMGTANGKKENQDPNAQSSGSKPSSTSGSNQLDGSAGSSNTTSKDSAGSVAGTGGGYKDPNAGGKKKKEPVNLPLKDTKQQDDQFIQWVINGKEDDMNQCESMLFQ